MLTWPKRRALRSGKHDKATETLLRLPTMSLVMLCQSLSATENDARGKGFIREHLGRSCGKCESYWWTDGRSSLSTVQLRWTFCFFGDRRDYCLTLHYFSLGFKILSFDVDFNRLAINGLNGSAQKIVRSEFLLRIHHPSAKEFIPPFFY